MRDARETETERSDDLAAWREAYGAEVSETGGACPAEERLAALAVGEMTGDERTELADHVVGCPRCAAAYRTLAELHEAAAELSPGSVRRPTRRRAWLVGAAAAAAIVAALALALLDLPLGPAGDRVVRGTDSLVLETDPADGARLAAPPERLRWSPAEEPGPAATYRVVLYDAESVPLWKSESTKEAAVEIPPAVRERLTPGAYYWRIQTDHGFDRTATPLLRFEIGG